MEMMKMMMGWDGDGFEIWWDGVFNQFESSRFITLSFVYNNYILLRPLCLRETALDYIEKHWSNHQMAPNRTEWRINELLIYHFRSVYAYKLPSYTFVSVQYTTLTIWSMDDEAGNLNMHSPTHFTEWYPKQFLWSCLQMNSREPHWWWTEAGTNHVLVSPGKKR